MDWARRYCWCRTALAVSEIWGLEVFSVMFCSRLVFRVFMPDAMFSRQIFWVSGGRLSRFTMTALKSRKMLMGWVEIPSIRVLNSCSPASVRE